MFYKYPITIMAEINNLASQESPIKSNIKEPN